MNRTIFRKAALSAALAAGVFAAQAPAYAWEPTKPVEFIVPAGTGGGADQMARFLQGVVAKHNMMKQPFVVVNKSGGQQRRRQKREKIDIPTSYFSLLTRILSHSQSQSSPPNFVNLEC